VNDNAKPSERDLGMLLGELKAQVAALHTDISEVRNALSEASESRRRVHEKIDAVDHRLVVLESTVTVMGGVVSKQTERMDHIEPTVEATAATVKTWALRLGLVATMVGILGGAAWYGLSNWGVALWRFVDQFIPKG
jgi:chromosome segregation ATPase